MEFHYFSFLVVSLLFVEVTKLNSVLCATLPAVNATIKPTPPEKSGVVSANEKGTTSNKEVLKGFLRGSGGGDKIYSDPGANTTLVVRQKPLAVMFGTVVEKISIAGITKPTTLAKTTPPAKPPASSSSNKSPINVPTIVNNQKQPTLNQTETIKQENDKNIQQKTPTLNRGIQPKQQDIARELPAKQIDLRKKDRNDDKNADKGGRNSNVSGKNVLKPSQVTNNNSKENKQKGPVDKLLPTSKPQIKPLQAQSSKPTVPKQYTLSDLPVQIKAPVTTPPTYHTNYPLPDITVMPYSPYSDQNSQLVNDYGSYIEKILSKPLPTPYTYIITSTGSPSRDLIGTSLSHEESLPKTFEYPEGLIVPEMPLEVPQEFEKPLEETVETLEATDNEMIAY